VFHTKEKLCSLIGIKMVKKYDEEKLRWAIKESISMAETLRKLELSTNTTNYIKFKNLISDLQIDITHWLGNGSNLGKTLTRQRKLSEILIINSKCKNNTDLKNRLIKENLLIYECLICKISKWLNADLTLQLDHINGINTDNRLENLRLLCPNCHSQTNTYAGKNTIKKYNSSDEKKTYIRSRRRSVLCPEKNCSNFMDKRSEYCSECSNKKHLLKTKIDWPEIDELIKMVDETNVNQVSKKLGVSYQSVLNRIKKYSKK